MKTYIDFLKEGNEGHSFRDVVNNLDEKDFENAAGEYLEYKLKSLSDEHLEDKFKTLIYDFGEINWNIITGDAWHDYFTQGISFDEKQLQDLRDFVSNLLV